MYNVYICKKNRQKKALKASTLITFHNCFSSLTLIKSRVDTFFYIMVLMREVPDLQRNVCFCPPQIIVMCIYL